MYKRLTCLLPIALFAAGCGGSGAHEAGPVPTAPASPPAASTSTETAPSTSTNTETSAIALCSDRTAAVSVASQEGAAGTISTVWRVRNTASVSCRSFGYPGMDFHTSSGWLNVRVHRGGFPKIDEPAAPVVLRPGRSLYFVSYWSDVSTNAGPCREFDRVKVTLPDNFVSAKHRSSGCVNPHSVDVGPVTTSADTTATEAAPAPVSCAPETGGEEGVYTNLVALRLGAHEGFDRVVFEFAAPNPNPGGKGGIPSYDIRTATPPFSEDPSDMRIQVEGDAFARIVLQGASGYDFNGRATYAGSRRLTPGFGTLAQVVEAGDFEATLTWILGLSRPTCWDIHELHNPDRLVIDFHHV